jgi:putative tryptophan/tyrosine transport system substrate-binding protein
MKRREFILALACVGCPIATLAQQPAVPVIGFLSTSSPETFAPRLAAFRQGLKESGYEEGRNIRIEYRWANEELSRLPNLVSDLVERRVTVIAPTGGGAPVLAAKAATSTIPIVFGMGSDPVALGLVGSLNRPGGNISGVTMLVSDVVAKRIEVLHEIVPRVLRLGFVTNPASPRSDPEVRELEIAADALGRKLAVAYASRADELEQAFESLVQQRVGGITLSPETLFLGQRNRIVALAARHAVPAVYQSREFTLAGGLMSFGSNVDDAYRQQGMYVGRVLGGENVGYLPIQRSTKVELVINLKTANTLSLTIPPTLLARADEVIE